MLQRRAFACTLVVVALGFFSLANGEEKDKQEPSLKGVKCLFCKMDVQKDAAVDYKGVKVFFGCAGCPEAFKRNPEKYATEANAQLVATKQAKQVACPLSGKQHRDEFKLTVNQAEVSFCCADCKKAVAKLDNEAQLKMLFNEAAFEKAFQIPKRKKVQ